MARDHESRKHYTTPQKAKLKAGAEIYSNAKVYSPRGTRQTKRQLFKDQNIPKGSAYRILKSYTSRRHYNEVGVTDKWGQKSKLTQKDLHHVEMLIWRHEQDGRVLS